MLFRSIIVPTFRTGVSRLRPHTRRWTSSEHGNPAAILAVSPIPPPSDLKTLPPQPSETDEGEVEGIALIKHLQRARVSSRRGAFKLIDKKKVLVNGRRPDNPMMRVTPKDTVFVAGTGNIGFKPKKQRLFIAHKLAGELVSYSDPKDRPLLFSRLEQRLELPKNLVAVGRLDFNTEGLIVLTTDPLFATYLEHPDRGLERRYEALVWSRGPMDQGLLNWFGSKFGVNINKMQFQPMFAAINKKKSERKRSADQKGAGTGLHTWVNLILHEGQNREVRKVFENSGMVVKRLVRRKFGPFKLGELSPGSALELDMGRSIKQYFSEFEEWKANRENERPKNQVRKKKGLVPLPGSLGVERQRTFKY